MGLSNAAANTPTYFYQWVSHGKKWSWRNRLQMAHVHFRSRKRVHTRLCSKDRTQRHTRRNRGLPDGAAITIPGAFRTFTNIPGPGIRTASFAAFGAWSGVLPKNAESLRDSDALMRVAVPRRRGPAGLRVFFVSVKIAACTPCSRNFFRFSRRSSLCCSCASCVSVRSFSARSWSRVFGRNRQDFLL